MRCELLVSDFFKLSVGHIALVGKIIPGSTRRISSTKADLYVNGEKIRTIKILGEDLFLGANKRRDIRSIRTDDAIENELINVNQKKVKLIIYL